MIWVNGFLVAAALLHVSHCHHLKWPTGEGRRVKHAYAPCACTHCRQCSSGLQAIASVAAAISAGFYNVGLAGGVETMSKNPMAWEGGVNPRLANFPGAQGCMMPMGVTSENVAEKFGVDRKTQVRAGEVWEVWGAVGCRARAVLRMRAMRKNLTETGFTRFESGALLRQAKV